MLSFRSGIETKVRILHTMVSWCLLNDNNGLNMSQCWCAGATSYSPWRERRGISAAHAPLREKLQCDAQVFNPYLRFDRSAMVPRVLLVEYTLRTTFACCADGSQICEQANDCTAIFSSQEQLPRSRRSRLTLPGSSNCSTNELRTAHLACTVHA